MSDKFAPTIIPAQPGYSVAEPRYGEHKTFDSFELIPIVAWMITPMPHNDQKTCYAETHPVTSFGWNTMIYHDGWMNCEGYAMWRWYRHDDDGQHYGCCGLAGDP
jgi:hypothetical protein